MLHIFRILNFSRKAKKIDLFFAKNAKNCEKRFFSKVCPLISTEMTSFFAWWLKFKSCPIRFYLLSIQSRIWIMQLESMAIIGYWVHIECCTYWYNLKKSLWFHGVFVKTFVSCQNPWWIEFHFTKKGMQFAMILPKYCIAIHKQLRSHMYIFTYYEEKMTHS